MYSQLTIALLAGLGGMFGWGLSDFFAKKTIDKVGDVISLAWGHIFGVLSLCVFIVHQNTRYGYQLPRSFDSYYEWLGLIFFGVGQAIIYLLLYRGFSKGQVGVLSPVFASFSGLTALASFVLFGEMLGGIAIFALGVIFLGILLMNIDPRIISSGKLSFNFKNTPGFLEVFSAMILASFWTLLWDRFLGGQDWLGHSFFMYVFMTVAILLFCVIRKINIFVIQQSTYKFLLFIGLFEVIAYASISLGYSKTGFTSVVALLSGAFSLPTIILAAFFLRERMNLPQIVGATLIISSIMLISLV